MNRTLAIDVHHFLWNRTIMLHFLTHTVWLGQQAGWVSVCGNNILSSHQSLNHRSWWGTTHGFTTSFLLFFSVLRCPLRFGKLQACPFSDVFPPFFCLPCLLLPFTVPYNIVLARLDELETCQYHFSLRLFTMVRKSWCGPIACWTSAQTSWLVTWSLHEMRSILL